VSEFLRAYLTVAVFGLAAGLLVALMLGLGKLVRPQRSTAQKRINYESGVDPVGAGFGQSQVRYYIFALLFVMFDVEAVFIFPWAVILDDLGVYGLLLGAAGGEDVARFVRRTVGPVLDYDQERGSELARTLLTWYSCGGNLTRTAAELYVHVNTLYQRLDRVTSLLGEGWRSGDGALQTHLALQAHRALGTTT